MTLFGKIIKGRVCLYTKNGITIDLKEFISYKGFKQEKFLQNFKQENN